MKATFVLSVFLAVAAARELTRAPVKRHHRMLGKREVPQEHSHEKFLTATREALNLNNPDEIVDPVFGLLGAAAAQQGAGKITDPECLQQATADQAFSNAKEAGNIELMTSALVFRTLERNTLSVGEKSKPCESIQAVNPEIAALQQHQDPASDGAAALNKEITLELARQIASIGGDPLVAIESGTFEPGQIGDPTAAGNTCNELDDPEGCIFTQNLLVEDATPEEIQAAVADVAVGGGNEDAVNTTTDVATTTEAATTTTEAATTTTDVATATDVATTTTATDAATTTTDAAVTTTTSADVVATECPAAVTVTVTVTAATATQTVVVNNGNGNGKNNRGNNRGNNRVIRIGGNNNNNRGNNRGNNGNGVVRIIKLGARWLGM